MSIKLNDNIKTSAPKPNDSRYFGLDGLTPWVDTDAVIAGIPETERHLGLTVNVAGTEYWFKEGILDEDITEKSSGAFVEGTYEEIKALKDSSSLVPGGTYVITDYQTKTLLGTTEILTGEIEELVLTATSENTFNYSCFSKQFPTHILGYDIDYNSVSDNLWGYSSNLDDEGDLLMIATGANTFTVETKSGTGEIIIDNMFEIEGQDDTMLGVGEYFYLYFDDLGIDWDYTVIAPNKIEITLLAFGGDLTTIKQSGGGEDGSLYISSTVKIVSRPGFVNYRKDTYQNIECNFDFVGMRKRIYRPNIASIGVYNSGTTYNNGQFVVYDNTIFKAVQNGILGVTPTINNNKGWIPVKGTANGYIAKGGFAGLNMDYLEYDYIDCPIFADSSFQEAHTGRVFNFKCFSGEAFVPVFYGSYQINNVDLGVTRNVFGYVDGGSISSINIKNGVSVFFNQSISEITSDYCNNTVFQSINGLNVGYIEQSSYFSCQRTSGMRHSYFGIAMSINVTIGVAQQSLIGIDWQYPQNINITNMSSTRAFMMVETNCGGYLHNCIFGRSYRNNFGQYFKNYTQDLTQQYIDVYDCSFSGICTTNTVRHNISSSDIKSMKSNILTGAISNLNVNTTMLSNYISSQIDYSIFNAFSYNGTAGAYFNSLISGINVGIFQFNSGNGGTILRGIGQSRRYCNFNYPFTRNSIGTLEAVTLSNPVGDNIGNKIESSSLSDFYGTIFGDIISSQLPATRNTIINGQLTSKDLTLITRLNEDYGKTISRISPSLYNLSWFDENTGLNYENI